ncbi:TPA: hypothetical protein ACN98A_004449 [Vibrio parahaemolyticus]
MQFWIYDETNGDTCEGATIGASMYGFSTDLFEGCKYNAHLAQNADQIYQIRSANMSCILFSISAIEAKLNELISMFASIGDEDSIWKQVQEKHSRKSTADKWNMLVKVTGGKRWEHSEEPFRSFNLVKALRNELVHYKGELLEKDQAPNKKVQEIMTELGIKSKASFMEDDCSSWVSDLIDSKELAPLVVKFITPIYENMNEYLSHEVLKSES